MFQVYDSHRLRRRPLNANNFALLCHFSLEVMLKIVYLSYCRDER